MTLSVVIDVATQCNTQTVVVQHRWVKSASEAADLVDGLPCYFSQSASLFPGNCQFPNIIEAAQADQESCQQLAGFIMQLAGNPAPLLLLRRECALQQEPVQRIGLLDLLGCLRFCSLKLVTTMPRA